MLYVIYIILYIYCILFLFIIYYIKKIFYYIYIYIILYIIYYIIYVYVYYIMYYLLCIIIIIIIVPINNCLFKDKALCLGWVEATNPARTNHAEWNQARCRCVPFRWWINSKRCSWWRREMLNWAMKKTNCWLITIGGYTTWVIGDYY